MKTLIIIIGLTIMVASAVLLFIITANLAHLTYKNDTFFEKHFPKLFMLANVLFLVGLIMSVGGCISLAIV